MPDMSKRGPVSDVFRERKAGNVSVSMNSKPATDDYHIDRARLGVHDEWDETAPNTWGGKGNVVQRSNSIMDNARASMGDLRACSSSKNKDAPKEATNSGPCCPSPYFGGSRLRKGD